MPAPLLKPYWTTTDRQTVRFYHGDVLKVLQRMPTGIVQTVVTSPPYWSLRDYGQDKSLEIGGEKTPQEYVERIVAVFHELRRVLRDDGTLWPNLGDTYRGGKCGRTDTDRMNVDRFSGMRNKKPGFVSCGASTLPGGNLVGIPWRVALALQADGWILRQDIIWHKPSPMPESVTNRCTKAHEYIFLLTKRQRYFYDAEAIKEKAKSAYRSAGFLPNSKKDLAATAATAATAASRNGRTEELRIVASNKRSVWRISTGSGYSGAHFATFPRSLVEPCILAGTSEGGCCSECRAPRQRVTERSVRRRSRPNDYVKRTGEEGTGNSCANSVDGVDVKTLGWEPTCSCGAGVVPCTVLDPFLGSGTTAVEALSRGRRCWGIDLSEEYLEKHAVLRVTDELLSSPATAGQIARQVKALEIGRAVRMV